MALQKLGKYEIVGELGRGAMGVVYKAFDPVLEREVALKTMMASMSGMDAESKARFYREARSAAKLTHRNIVTIYDMGEEEGIPFIAMEFLDGVDLHKKMKRDGPMPLKEGLKITSQILHGLNYAHQFQIVHRDIKPANVYILKNGTAKILDFGIAKLASSEMTRTGMVLGTVDYMSPEQIRADKMVDGRSDLFSAGVILFEMMAGCKPFPGETITQVMFKIVHDSPGEMPTERELPPRLVAISRRALEKDPAVRFQTGEDFANDLEAVIRDIDAELTTVRQMAPASLDPRAGISNARRLFEGGSFIESAAMLREVLKKDPENREATALFTVVERRLGGSDKTVMLDGEGAQKASGSSGSGARSGSIEQILAEIEEERKTGHDPARSDAGNPNLTLRLDDSGPQPAPPVAAKPQTQTPSRPAPPPPVSPDRPTEQFTPPSRAVSRPEPLPKGERKTEAKPSPTATPKPAAMRQPAASPAAARSPLPMILGGAAVLALIVGVVLYMRSSKPAQPSVTTIPQSAPSGAPSGAPPASTGAPAAATTAGFLAIDAEPWAEVTAIREAGGGKATALPAEAGHAGPTTPLVVPLPPGRYEVVLRNPEFQEVTLRDVQIAPGEWTRKHQMMPGFSYKSKMPAGVP
ncbi:MAG: protein kinase [Acidobacteria bacterium]|nr:protein kinase [Acidobacteriota bacterium]